MGCDSTAVWTTRGTISFNSRTPCGVRPLLMLVVIGSGRVSIHAPRVGCDIDYLHQILSYDGFNSRTPCGVRHITINAGLSACVFQFTHPVWGATIRWFWDHLIIGVSIHAPRVGCDCLICSFCFGLQSFNSRTPCGVRRDLSRPSSTATRFQFTHPVWGATILTANT